MNVLGRWKKVTQDNRCSATTILTLNGDGSYRYELSVKVASSTYTAQYGGVHVGTYKINESEIEMSGDDRWRPGTQCLTEYTRLDRSEKA